MLSILCPHCATKLTVEEQWRGRTINCLSCGKQLAVPTKATNSPPETSSLGISTRSKTARRRRKRPLGNRLISTALHLSITAATIYAAYYLISQRKPADSPPTVQKHIEKPTQLKKKRDVPSTPEAVQIEEPAPVEEAIVAAPVEKFVPPSVSPFEKSPRQVALPPSDGESGFAIVDNIANIQFVLISNSAALTLTDQTVFWESDSAGSSQPIATLELVDGSLNFHWLAPVPEQAEAMLRNSILRLSSNEFQHVVALREAKTVAPLQIDLSKSQQRILSKCQWLPDPTEIHFGIIGLDELPATTHEGGNPTDLLLRDQSTLHYSETTGAATRFTTKKRGKLVAVEMESRYALPSGDEQPMLISKGNKKFKEITAIHQKLLAAEQAVPQLRTSLKDLQSEARGVPRSRATATEKAVRLNNLQTQISAIQQKLSYGERLLSQKSAIEADYQAIQQVAKLAQQLHEAKLAYRFFTVIDGHEVDVLIAR